MTRRLSTLVAVVMLFVAATALGLALLSADASLPNAFRTYPTCDVRERDRNGNPQPDRTCSKGDRFAAVLISRFASNPYRLCFRRPDGKHRCVQKPAHPPPHPRPSIVKLYLRAGRHAVGKWQLKWLNYRRGYGHVVIGRDRLHVRR